MDPDDDFEFNEDFLDDFISRDEPQDQLSNSENSSKRQKIDSQNCVESSISFRLNDDDDDDNNIEVSTSTTNDDKNKKSTNNSRLTKILQICQKKKNSTFRENELSESENSRELNFYDNSSSNLSLNLSANSHIENKRNRVSFLIDDNDDNNDNDGEKNRDEEKEGKGGKNDQICNKKANIRENLIKSILSRKKRKIDEIEENEDERKEKRKEGNGEEKKGEEKRDEEEEKEEEKRDEEKSDKEVEEELEKNEKSHKVGNVDQNERKIQNRQNLINSILKNRGKRPEIESDNDEAKERRNVSFSHDSTISETNKTEKYKQLKLNFPQTSESTKNHLNSSSKINNSLERYRNRKSIINSSHNKSRTKLNNSKTGKHVISRRFPGPAGLLPENMDFSNLPMAYLNTFDESETVVERLNETRITNFCSQNTKNRFTSGAWQMMIDDLPVDFFQSLDIATIKRQAKKGHYKMKCTKFFAALVHQMDSNTIINPIVVLKDSSDEIEASIHRRIISKYPNAIDVGVVLLLNNVTIITSKFYNMALVHTSDVVAIYNEKERIVTTELMEKIIREQEGSNFDDSRDTGNEERTIREKIIDKLQQEAEERNKELSVTDSTKDNNNEESTTSASRENAINPKEILLDNEDNEFLSQLNLDEISVSNNNDPRIIASSTLIGNEIHLENDSGQDKDNLSIQSEKSSSTLYERFKQFRHRECSTQMKINNENTQDQINTGESTVILDEENFTDLLDSEEDIADEFSAPKRCENNAKIIKEKIEENAPGPSKLQSRFKQFRHSEELSQPEVVVGNKKNNEMEKNIENLNFSTLLSSDDEFMDRNVPKECDNGKSRDSEAPVKNTQEMRNNFQSFYSDDEADDLLSQVNVDDF